MRMQEMRERERYEYERQKREQEQWERRNAPKGPPSVERFRVDAKYNVRLGDGIDGIEFTKKFRAINLAGHRVYANLVFTETESAYTYSAFRPDCEILQDTDRISLNCDSRKSDLEGFFRVPYSNFVNKDGRYKAYYTATITITDEDGNALGSPETIDFFIG